MKTVEAKVVVLGSQGVGKTSLVVRYLQNSFKPGVSPTIGASFFTCKLVVDSHRLRLQIWDTAGQERFRAMAPMYYRNATAAFLVYDLTSEESFDDIKQWVKELQKNVGGYLVTCVLGNKSDLTAERVVALETAEAYADSIGAKHFDTSALTSQGVSDAFLYVARSIIEQSEVDPEFSASLHTFSDPDHSTRVNSNDTQQPLPRGRGCCSS